MKQATVTTLFKSKDKCSSSSNGKNQNYPKSETENPPF